MKQENKEKDTKEKQQQYTIIRKFNNEGESFQKVMENLLIRKTNEI